MNEKLALNSVFNRVLAHTFKGWSKNFMFRRSFYSFPLPYTVYNSCFITHICVKMFRSCISFFNRAFNHFTAEFLYVP
jgi:hypothetical protein